MKCAWADVGAEAGAVRGIFCEAAKCTAAGSRGCLQLRGVLTFVRFPRAVGTDRSAFEKYSSEIALNYLSRPINIAWKSTS